jgi:hypothetical protein
MREWIEALPKRAALGVAVDELLAEEAPARGSGTSKK